MSFLHEGDVQRLAARAGLLPPRHGWLGQALPFAPGEPVVLKGLARELWHKSELGALAFLPFDGAALAAAAEAMRARVEAAGHDWVGALVCERIAAAASEGLPSEALVSLARRQGVWTLVVGLGGLQAEALGALVPPLVWPLGWLERDEALAELKQHLLGQVWLGALRGARPLTDEARLERFLAALWRLGDIAEAEGLELLEMNPVALDARGEPRPLDGVGQRAPPASAPRAAPPPFLPALLAPRRVAVVGVSARAGGMGHVIVDNLRAAGLAEGALVIVKPGEERFLGLPALPDVAALAAAPVDLLLLALPAAAAVAALEALVAQGGGAALVGLVAGGIGDGADRTGLGERVRALLEGARAAGRWTPALLGPNFLGHVVPRARLCSTFIPTSRWPVPARSGPLALLSQSGAFILSRLARAPELPLGLALALGNQLDVHLGHVLEGLADEPELRAVAAYVEGFGPGELAATARAAKRLTLAGRSVLLYRAARSEAGQAAAASHTGALAGDRALEAALLARAGVRLADSIAAFDAAMMWLAHDPALAADAAPAGEQARPLAVAVVSNAGFETVSAADGLGGALPAARLGPGESEALAAVLERHGLSGVASPRLPLDLTPMADLAAYRDAVGLLLGGEARVVVVGLVPFSARLDLAALPQFAAELGAAARARGRTLGLVIDAQPDPALAAAIGLPLFTRLEEAIAGLRVLARGTG